MVVVELSRESSEVNIETLVISLMRARIDMSALSCIFYLYSFVVVVSVTFWMSTTKRTNKPRALKRFVCGAVGTK